MHNLTSVMGVQVLDQEYWLSVNVKAVYALITVTYHNSLSIIPAIKPVISCPKLNQMDRTSRPHI